MLNQDIAFNNRYTLFGVIFIFRKNSTYSSKNKYAGRAGACSGGAGAKDSTGLAASEAENRCRSLSSVYIAV